MVPFSIEKLISFRTVVMVPFVDLKDLVKLSILITFCPPRNFSDYFLDIFF